MTITTAHSGSIFGAARSVLATVVLIILSLPAHALELRVTIDGIRSSSGTILIGLYDRAECFERAIELSDKEGLLNDPARVAGAALKATTRLKSGVVFLNLDPGRYAVIVFQDENGNGRLDKNAWGVPTEPYGFSNNAEGFLGPPSFAEAAILLDGSDTSITIAFIYHGAGSPEPAGPLAETE